MEPNTHLIIDTDVGLDDLYAITLLLQQSVQPNSSTTIHAISSVKGLQLDTAHCTNILHSLVHEHLQQKRVQILTGYNSRLDENNGHCFSEANWYKDFLDQKLDQIHYNICEHLNAPFCKREATNSEKPVEEALYELISSQPDQYFTLVCLGPLTNIAKLFQKDETIASKLKCILFMGGALFCTGNTTEGHPAEWNFYSDPIATKIVFDALGRQCKEDASKVIMAGLDAACFDAISHSEVKNRILSPFYQKNESLNTSQIPSKYEIQVKVGKVLQRLTEIGLGSYTFDPIAVSYLVKPEMYQIAPHYVEVLVNKSNEGQTTAISKEEHEKRKVGTHLTAVLKLDTKMYIEYLLEQLCLHLSFLK